MIKLCIMPCLCSTEIFKDVFYTKLICITFYIHVDRAHGQKNIVEDYISINTAKMYL